MIPACYRGWMAGKQAQRSVRYGEELPPNGPACLPRASHQRCGPAASRIARPRCVRGSSRRKPAGRYPEVLPRMGLPAPFPGGGGHAHPCTPQFVPSRIGHTSVRRTSLRRDPGPGARHTAGRSPASHALHFLRLPGWRNIRRSVRRRLPPKSGAATSADLDNRCAGRGDEAASGPSPESAGRSGPRFRSCLLVACELGLRPEQPEQVAR